MDTVNRWLATRTFHHGNFADVEELIRRKEALGLSLSLCIPTLNEAATIGTVVSRLYSALRIRLPLLDEIAVIDSGSTDRTLELASTAGASVYRAADILPEMGRQCGKGENLWKALYRLKGDILIFLDADITNVHPGFVTGLVGPLLQHPEIGYVKSFYERPAFRQGEEYLLGGGRVTEILIRPLFSLYFPELTAFIQPLAGEYAARRSVLEALSFPVGYGVETAHLIDLHARHGMNIFAQTDMGQRRHRSRSNPELGRMAFAILQVVARRLSARGQWHDCAEGGGLLRQFGRDNDRYREEISTIDEPERPPMRGVAAYRQQQDRVFSGHGQASKTANTNAGCPAAVAEH
jgi:glucosyl-3-phosphoglycerate synthase